MQVNPTLTGISFLFFEHVGSIMLLLFFFIAEKFHNFIVTDGTQPFLSDGGKTGSNSLDYQTVGSPKKYY